MPHSGWKRVACRKRPNSFEHKNDTERDKYRLQNAKSRNVDGALHLFAERSS